MSSPPSPLRVLFLSALPSPNPTFSLCTPSLSCGSPITPPVTPLGGDNWAADVALPSLPPSAGAGVGGGAQWVLRMQTDQGVVFSSPFALSQQGGTESLSALPSSTLSPTLSPSPSPSASPTPPSQSLQTLILTGTPLPLSTSTPIGSPTPTCSSSPSPSSSLSLPSTYALPLALSLCLPLVLAMCLFLLHFCRRRRRQGGAEEGDCIFPPSPPLAAIERLEKMDRRPGLPPLVTAGSELTLIGQEEPDPEELKDVDLEHPHPSKSEAQKLKEEKSLPPPPPPLAYEGIRRKQLQLNEMDRALLLLGRALSDSALSASLGRVPSLFRARSELSVPRGAVLRGSAGAGRPREVGREGRKVSFALPSTCSPEGTLSSSLPTPPCQKAYEPRNPVPVQGPTAAEGTRVLRGESLSSETWGHQMPSTSCSGDAFPLPVPVALPTPYALPTAQIGQHERGEYFSYSHPAPLLGSGSLRDVTTEPRPVSVPSRWEVQPPTERLERAYTCTSSLPPSEGSLTPECPVGRPVCSVDPATAALPSGSERYGQIFANAAPLCTPGALRTAQGQSDMGEYFSSNPETHPLGSSGVSAIPVRQDQALYSSYNPYRVSATSSGPTSACASRPASTRSGSSAYAESPYGQQTARLPEMTSPTPIQLPYILADGCCRVHVQVPQVAPDTQVTQESGRGCYHHHSPAPQQQQSHHHTEQHYPQQHPIIQQPTRPRTLTPHPHPHPHPQAAHLAPAEGYPIEILGQYQTPIPPHAQWIGNTCSPGCLLSQGLSPPRVQSPNGAGANFGCCERAERIMDGSRMMYGPRSLGR
ncbi:hypothetical protein DACRYDRAFT_16330 [Dacryopinax primogenitus]|uniref:Uncharacterized protein n=1 Tax=Dacryopinax primogenitus (strain DJM 731) TaxID=1858805 RepID=M5GAH7_DACPD|nr:uncharacterized protein DACRYDRAFT_16330 [Dacryopinax primogenitus]EJU00918.1 hypothetical protein DACRYDRAFT_16330 [Dacryopinax primogenitus]